MIQALAVHDNRRLIAVGRKFKCNKGALLGGGPGIAISTGAMAALGATQCHKLDLPIISKSVPGPWLCALLIFTRHHLFKLF